MRGKNQTRLWFLANGIRSAMVASWGFKGFRPRCTLWQSLGHLCRHCQFAAKPEFCNPSWISRSWEACQKTRSCNQRNASFAWLPSKFWAALAVSAWMQNCVAQLSCVHKALSYWASHTRNDNDSGESYGEKWKLFLGRCLSLLQQVTFRGLCHRARRASQLYGFSLVALVWPFTHIHIRIHCIFFMYERF